LKRLIHAVGALQHIGRHHATCCNAQTSLPARPTLCLVVAFRDAAHKEFDMRIINRRVLTLLAATAVVALGACSGMSTRDQDMAVGAGIGAVGGAVLTGGSAIGTVGGAVVGGVIGNEVGKK
jgi:osmotically inducible lipoprotein OsmB